MKINREEFLNDLEMVKAGLSPREFVEQSSCFCFRDGEVMTFNDEVACRKQVGLQVTGAIQANNLLAILEKLDDTELLIRENDKGELEFKGKRKGFGITKDAEIFLPIDKVERPKQWVELPKEFTEAVGLVQHCVSSDESRFLLTCVHIHPNYVEACDNLQIMRVKVKTGVKSSILVRGTSLVHITSLGMDQMSMSKSWIHFKNHAGLILSCRIYSEDYPILDELMKVKGGDIVIPKGLAEASERAAVFANDKSGDPHISVKIADGRVRLLGEGLTGWYREVKKVTYDGPTIEFVIAPELLHYISEKYSEAKINETKLKAEGGHWTYVTVLGMMAKEEEEEDKE
jgi:DNA polymerase III sliding clamp (beta) subunit (PCNA family)